jgi:nanoRNase/pAp phosphatase (c-di-AMP/oligoRNAs hydrolase)
MSDPPLRPFDLDGALARVAGKPALVLMHDNPDPDSMAGAEGLRALLESVGCAVTVARGGIIGRVENRMMVEVLGLKHVPVAEIDFSAYGAIALVDTQPETGNNSLPLGHRCDIVVDHHPARPEAARAWWCDIREDFGASSTIVFTYLRDRNVPISQNLATAFLYAIKSETRDLGREASQHEYDAYTHLFRLADLEKMHAIAEPRVPAAYFATLDRALRAAEVRGPLVAANLGTLDYPDLVAEIADLLLAYDQARWVLCVGEHHGTVFLSVRTDLEDGKAGEVIRAIVAGRGAAGGHGMIAGGKLHAPVSGKAALSAVYHQLIDALCAELEITTAAPVPLLPHR